MALTNEVRINGRVATEPQQNGKGPLKFRIGHGGGGQRKDGTPWPTQFFSVSCWDSKIMSGIAKGARVEIFGKLHDSTFTTKEGVVRYGTEIVAESIVVEAAEPRPDPLTPNARGGTAIAQAILKPGEKNAHGVNISNKDLPW